MPRPLIVVVEGDDARRLLEALEALGWPARLVEDPESGKLVRQLVRPDLAGPGELAAFLRELRRKPGP